MAADYDLSNLPTDQAEVWICLQADVIYGQIVADQAERLGFSYGPGHSIVSTLSRRSLVIFSNRLRGVGV
jgi:hypothetical protein